MICRVVPTILLCSFSHLFYGQSYGCGAFGIEYPCCCETASCYTCADIIACENMALQTGDSPGTFATALEPGDCDVAGTPCSTWWENNNYGVNGDDRGDGAPDDCLSPCGDPIACNFDPIYGPDAPDYAQNCTYGCGCADSLACNYDPYASVESDSCLYPDFGLDCAGLCLDDTDGDGVCDGDEILGCTDELACNFESEATDDDGSCVPSGCMDPDACNYLAAAGCDDGNCDYSCCPGPACCGPGTHWDWNTSTCVITNPTDVDLDNCVGVADVLNVLSMYGECFMDDTAASWMCGDTLEYWGYWYPTVEIGGQCWFTENLRNEKYANGDSIPNVTDAINWQGLSSGARCDYDNDLINASTYGRLYNWYAVNDMRGLCPIDWHVPADEEFMTMEMALGMPQTDTNSLGWSRGTDEGAQLKASASDSPSWNGTNTSEFHGLAGGQRFGGGSYGDDQYGLWWSGTDSSGSAWVRILSSSFLTVKRDIVPSNHGLSVRCVKDPE